MNKKLFLLVPFAIVIAAIGWQVQKIGSETAIMEAHPEIDPDLVVAAHRLMVKRTLHNAYADIDMTDEKCEEIFLSIVEELKQ